MAKLDLKTFMKDSKSEGKMSDILNLKEKGKMVVWLHGDTGIESRKSTYIPVVKEQAPKGKKGGKKEKIVSGQLVILGDNYNECPIRQLIKAVREDENLDDDDVIFEVGTGKNKTEYLKGDLIGSEGYDWKKRVKTNTEYIFGAIDKDNVSGGTQILIAPKSLGKAITNVIENQMEQAKEEEDDEDLGDPFKNPYAFKLIYNEDEQPSLMYRADFFKAKLTKDVKELLEGDGVNVDGFTRPTSTNDICDMIAEILVAEVEGFDVDDFRTEEKDSKKKSSKKAPKKIEEDDEDLEDEDLEEEDEEEEEIKPKKNNKKDPKKTSKKSKKVEIEEEEEDEDLEDEEEEEEIKPKKNNKKDKKEDKKKSSKKTSKKVEVEEDEDDEDEEEEEEEKPKKNSKKGKKEDKKTSKKSKKNQVECPSCGEMVDEDATECHECGAEFDDESLIICPDCGTENSEDAKKCKKCKTELMPF